MPFFSFQHFFSGSQCVWETKNEYNKMMKWKKCQRIRICDVMK